MTTPTAQEPTTMEALLNDLALSYLHKGDRLMARLRVEVSFASLLSETARLRKNAASAVRVWPFHDAPDVFRSLSTHGGDEDWVAHIPASLSGTYFGWMQEGGSFGCCAVSEHRLADGSVIRIGAHA